ncbi:MAG: Rpp14/Pop5 family protein [Candidatus Nanoarchaeia archaeon]
MREKKRYLVFEVVAKHNLSFGEVRNAIRDGLLRFLGELGFAKAGVMILDDWKNNKGVMKVSNKHVDEVRAGLALIKKVGNETVIVRTVGVSGILRKARGKFS